MLNAMSVPWMRRFSYYCVAKTNIAAQESIILDATIFAHPLTHFIRTLFYAFRMDSETSFSDIGPQ
jgi:hypothetical protein